MSNVQNPLSIKLKARVVEVSETELVGNNAMKKRELIVEEVDTQYPQTFKIEFIKDKVDLLNPLIPLMTILVSVNVRGKEVVRDDGSKMYFQSMQGWKIELV